MKKIVPAKPAPRVGLIKTEEKDVAKDLKKFEALPAKTKELASLQDEAAKTSGPKAVELQKKIKVIEAG